MTTIDLDLADPNVVIPLLNGFTALIVGCAGILVAHVSMKRIPITQIRLIFVAVWIVGLASTMTAWLYWYMQNSYDVLFFVWSDGYPLPVATALASSVTLIPPLLFTPAAVFCIVLVYVIEKKISPETWQTAGAIDLACRMTWMSFWFAMLGIVPGCFLFIAYWFLDGTMGYF